MHGLSLLGGFQDEVNLRVISINHVLYSMVRVDDPSEWASEKDEQEERPYNGALR